MLKLSRVLPHTYFVVPIIGFHIICKCRDDVVSLISKVKRLTVADLVETMEVQVSIDHPSQKKQRVSIDHHEVARIYRLKMRLKDTQFVSMDDIRDTLESVFLVELEDAVENHIIFCSKVSGIRNLMSSSTSEAASSEADEDSGARTKRADDDDDEDDDYDKGDDLGSDAQKRKQQASDEMDYDDASSDGSGDEDMEKRKSDAEDVETSKDEGSEHSDDGDDEVISEAQSIGKEGGGKSLISGKGFSSKKIRRAVYLKSKGHSFEIHFRFTTEPHVLLAQVPFSS